MANIRMTSADWSKNLWSRIKALFSGLDTRVTALEQGGGGGGGDTNVIEAISFNGSNVPPDANKRVSLTESDPTVPSWAKANSKPTYTASEVGAIASTEKGANSGVATLDSSGKVPSSQLPAVTVTDGDPTLAWSTRSVVGTVNGTDLHVTMPANPGGGGGGDVNVIESISLNGTTVQPDANKNVALVESDPTVPSWAKANSKPSYSASEISGLGDLAVKDSASGSYTPAGTVSAPTISVSSAGSTASVTPIATVGSLPTLTFTVSGSTLTIDWSAGALPTKGTDVTVKTGDAAYSASTPTFTGTAATISVA